MPPAAAFARFGPRIPTVFRGIPCGSTPLLGIRRVSQRALLPRRRRHVGVVVFDRMGTNTQISRFRRAGTSKVGTCTV